MTSLLVLTALDSSYRQKITLEVHVDNYLFEPTHEHKRELTKKKLSNNPANPKWRQSRQNARKVLCIRVVLQFSNQMNFKHQRAEDKNVRKASKDNRRRMRTKTQKEARK